MADTTVHAAACSSRTGQTRFWAF